MGMSASQMRYCLIAGKKNDVEFQGQQINQQRTTLATQSSAANTQLLNMSVPTPPSSTDYTTTSYTFIKDGETCSITGTQYQAAAYTDDDGNSYAAGTYIVDYTNETTEDVGKTSGTKSILATNSGTAAAPVMTYTVGTSGSGSNNLEALDFTAFLADDATTDPAAYKKQSENFSNVLKIMQDCNLTVASYDLDGSGAGTATGTKVTTTAQLKAYLAANKTTTGGKNEYGIYSYTTTGSTTTPAVTKYALGTDLPKLPAGQSSNASAVSLYYVDEDANVTDSNKLYGAEVTWSDSGRMSAVTTSDKNGNKFSYSLSVETVKDDDAYDDAYNEYEFKKNEYDNDIQAVNAKIDIIQAQDKKLELKLQDLDTQQEALSTEMDSVKKVIDKNIESSFKAFA